MRRKAPRFLRPPCPMRRTVRTHDGGDGSNASKPIKDTVDTSTTLLSKLQSQVVALEESLEAAKKRNSECINVREALEAEATQVAQLAVDAKVARDQLEAECEQLQATIDTLEEEITTCDGEMEKLNKRIEKRKAKKAKQVRKETQMFSALLADKESKEGEAQDESQDNDASAESLASAEVPPAEPAEAPAPAPAPASQDASPLDTIDDAAETDIDAELVELRAELAGVKERWSAALDAKALAEVSLNTMQEKLKSASTSAERADEVASGAMRAAEAAVEDELKSEREVAKLEDELEGFLLKLGEQVKAMTPDDEEDARVEVGGELAEDVARALREGEQLLPRIEEGTLSKTAKALTPAEEPEEKVSAPRPTRSSKQLAAGFFSPSGGGDPREALKELGAHVMRHRWAYAAGSVLAVVAALGILDHFHVLSAVRNAVISPFRAVGAALSAASAALAPWLAKLPVPHMEPGMADVLVLLATSIVSVPLISRIPGGGPVLGFLVGGALIGPYSLGLIEAVEAVKHISELGVIFLLFNIGLELSLERLSSMGKYVFGLGSAQVTASLAAIAAVLVSLGTMTGPVAVVVGSSLALSSTAVALQVLQDRGESSSRHGRATFSVLLLQDLAVVAILMLIPLLAPGENGGTVGFATIMKALGFAAVKAAVCIAAIIAGGRVIIRPLYKRIAATGNAEIFSATTLLTCLGTSVMTQAAGLSMALGAFLAGLLLAETEYSLQVESDIAPYRGLLLGLFFMTVGMEISPTLLIAQWQTILLAITALIVGKVAIMAAVGPIFGLKPLTSARAGLFLAPGGEFAFVALGDAVSRGLLAPAVCNQLFLVVALSMALTPYLAALGDTVGEMLDKDDQATMEPKQADVDDLRGHVLICGFGRSGQIIAQLFSERLIPFVAVDVRSDRVQTGRALDLPVYFGDSGSEKVLHAVGAHKAACAVIALDSPGANYRTVWALNKHFPNCKTFVRAHDVDHGIILEKAGATAVVPETLEPSLQLAAAALTQIQMPLDEVASTIDAFRRNHMRDLMALANMSNEEAGGWGESRPKSKPPKEFDEATPAAVPSSG
ncbi:unnamed protein product [Pedinophyceae sp. YPF-701]|nr:unnamed protein product [Pedinophyceae sp. YPF-701]